MGGAVNSLPGGWPVARHAAFGLMVALGYCLAAAAQEQPLPEYQIKAAFLYNFARFVEWPAEAFHKTDEPFTICVLGQDPFGQYLDAEVVGKTISGRPVAVQRIAGTRLPGVCHILFAGSSADKGVLSVSAAKQSGVLTVGDAGTAASDSLIISFRMENGKVRFAIDPAAADRAGLHISSKLLSLAQARRR
jgi:hypothetical protein